MNKIIKLSLCIFLTIQLNAQKQIVWFDCGLKAQGGASALYNKTIADGAEYDYTLGLTASKGFGAKIGINFQYNGISIEGFRNSFSQELQVLPANTNQLATIKWSSTDLYLLYRNAKNLGYFELGPKVSFLSKVNTKLADLPEIDAVANYNKMNYAGVLGFGANIFGNDGAFSGILGLRFEYGINDMVSNVTTNQMPVPYTGAVASTVPIFAGLVFELNWGIGYFGRAQCGARSKFMKF